jgi:hypothetical protein
VEITRVLDAALRKAAAVWVAPAGQRPRLVWTVWRGGALWLAVCGEEQQVPGLSDGVTCEVTVRSPTTHSRLATVSTVARLVDPDEDTTSALTAARLNAPPTWTQVFRLDVVA